MRHPGSTNSASSRRTFILVTAVVLLAAISWLAKGSGLKTWITWHVLGRVPHGYKVARHEESLSDHVRLTTDPMVQFDRVPLPTTNGAAFTCARFGPDGKFYAGAIDGRIFRFNVLPDGTLSGPEVFKSLEMANNGPRLLTGFAFDPASTADKPILWCSNGYFGFAGVPDWTGKITRISGADLSVVEDVVVNLPRSIRDHLTNQPKFGPDGALYFPQGCNSAYGGADPGWGDRPERILSGTVLRLDVKAVVPGEPLDAKTRDGGGSYDPFAPGAPLTIYACGVRNAYSLVWTSDGRLYVPTNGSDAGGNTPAGPGVPALMKLPLVEDDWLFRITPGRYYGHPNPQLGHFVLNGGNPGGPHTPATIPLYPLGTKPDPDWMPAVYDFGPHVSANGVVEYLGNAFGGRLNRTLIVCRFNAGSDLVCVLPDKNGEFSWARSLAGSEDLNQPLDVTEDLRNGNLYVSEYGAKRITLMRPTTVRSNPFLAVSHPPRGSGSARVENGRELFNVTCIACHGVHGQGIPNLGANLQQSKFIAQTSDDTLVAFIKTGRVPGDPRSVLNLTMPPRGGNPSLDDAGIRDIVAYLRTLQSQAAAELPPYTPSVATTRD
jgi:glucose/arabinose dehydrogenase/mono/diheme cytochrome c family protein